MEAVWSLVWLAAIILGIVLSVWIAGHGIQRSIAPPHPLRTVAAEVVDGLADGSLTPDPPLYGGYQPKGPRIENPKPPRGGTAIQRRA